MRPIFFSLLGSLCLLISGCGTSGSYDVGFDKGREPWDLPTRSEAGKLTFTTQLAPVERVTIYLDGNDGNGPRQAGFFQLLDEDCDSGHRGRLVFEGDERSGYQSLYFENEIPWGEPIHVKLVWNRSTLTASVNNEQNRVPLKLPPDALRVEGFRRDDDATLSLDYTALDSQSSDNN